MATKHYRKIYEEHYGLIPVDEEGRTYEIHHLDGDHSNDDPHNLIAVPIWEHFYMHWLMADWKSCHAIAIRMRVSPIEKSKLASEANRQRVRRGTNPFVGPNVNRRKIENGTHPWVGGKQSSKNARRLVSEGRHPFSGGAIQSGANRERVKAGTHNFLGGSIQRRQLKEGTHNFQLRRSCHVCGYTNNTGNVAIHMRKHA